MATTALHKGISRQDINRISINVRFMANVSIIRRITIQKGILQCLIISHEYLGIIPLLVKKGGFYGEFGLDLDVLPNYRARQRV